jgi:hypothetical protein
MWGMAARNPRYTPVRLTAIIRPHSSGAHSCSGDWLPIPALLNRVVIPPMARAASSTAAPSASASVTSATCAVAPISWANSWAASALMSMMATDAPSSTMRAAVARPIPEAPPVITAR